MSSMHTLRKSRGRVLEVFAKFWKGGYTIGVVKILGGGCLIAFLLTSFAKNLERRYTFIPPPPHTVVIYLNICARVYFNFQKYQIFFNF
jgi:hypothetical protein